MTAPTTNETNTQTANKTANKTPPPEPPARATILRGPVAAEPAYHATRYVKGAVYEAELEIARMREALAAERAELGQARDAAEAAGREAGAEATKRTMTTLVELGRALARRYEEDVLLAASAIVAALLDVDDHAHDDAIASLARAALTSVRFDRQIVLHAAPRSARWLQSLADELGAEVLRADEFHVAVDDSMADGELRVTTEHGERGYSIRARLRRLRREARRSQAPTKAADSAAGDTRGRGAA